MKMRSYVRVVVACTCGLLPLNDHANSQEAWEYAAKHAKLNPTKCHPSMYRVSVDIPVRA